MNVPLSTASRTSDLGNKEYIIGLHIIRDKGGIFVSQKSYGEAVLARFGMADCCSLSTPMEPNLQLQKLTAPVDLCLKCRYLQAIGSLMYAPCLGLVLTCVTPAVTSRASQTTQHTLTGTPSSMSSGT